MKPTFVVHHILSASDDIVSLILERQLAMSNELTEHLLFQGAIWCNHLRVREDIRLKKGDYLRVHTEPRRFPSQNICWRDAILFENEEFVVVNKPSGIPVHATVDNFVENVVYGLQNELKCEIHVTQRLDIPTAGVLLLAKTKTFQQQFNQLLRERNIRKFYCARVESYLSPAVYTHYMEQTVSSPKSLSRQPLPGWQECRLIITATHPVENDFDIDIELLTGRTHQIRAQLKDLGAPILGDKMYGSQRTNPWHIATDATTESIALKSQRLEFVHPLSKNNLVFIAK